MWGFGTGGEKSSALLLRPERKSADNHAVKACAAQQGVERCARAHDHIDKFQFGGDEFFPVCLVFIVLSFATGGSFG